MPQYNALFGVSFLASVNLLTIPPAISVLRGRSPVLDASETTRFLLLMAFLLILVCSYFLLVHGEKYKVIVKEFKNETPAEKRKKLIALVAYVLLTFAAFFGILSL